MEQSTPFLQLASERYSVRKFESKPIPKELIEQVLKAGHVAPTACNNQPQRIIVVQSEEALQKLRKCTECHFHAPCALIVCYDKARCWVRSYDGKTSGDIDAAIVTTHMMLQAQALGLGTTWVMYFIPDAVRAEFALPEDVEPVAILVLGYPAKDAKVFPGHLQYRDESEIVSYNEL